MELNTAIELLRPAVGIVDSVSVWADLGSGSGLFSTALGSLLPDGSTIYAVDQDKRALEKLKPIEGIRVEKKVADFQNSSLDFALLDGILMANSLHYVKAKTAFLDKAKQWLKADGTLIIIEYDMNSSNPWVPYPITYSDLKELLSQQGFTSIQKTAEHPSVFNRANMYVAKGRLQAASFTLHAES